MTATPTEPPAPGTEPVPVLDPHETGTEVTDDVREPELNPHIPDSDELSHDFAVGFDIDLTLVDSRARITAVSLQALAEQGVEVTPGALRPLLGVPLVLVAEAFGLGAPDAHAVGAFVDRYRELYNSPDAPRAPAMPGAHEALTAARAAGIRCVAVSAKLPETAEQALAEAGLIDLIDAVYGGVFAEEKATPMRDEAVRAFAGDHVADMRAATAVPCAGIGVATGIHDQEELREAGATVTVPNLHAFPDALRLVLQGEQG